MDDPDMGYWTYTYDANGNLVTQTDAKGQVKNFYYDALNRLTEEDYTSDYPTVYEYDQGINGIGRLYKVTKENVSPQIDTYTRYDEYDVMGRVREVTKWMNGSGEYTTQYNYDLSGKTTKITYPDGYEVDYVYYAGTNLLYTATGSDSEVYAQITYYEPAGQIHTLKHGNGVMTLYDYDSRSMRIKGVYTYDKNFSIIQKKDYKYTPAGDIDTIIDTHNNKTFDYTYDNLHRLIEERTNGAVTATYSYNNIGNITSKSMGTDNFNFTAYHSSHKHAVQNINLNGTPYYYTYDNNGNMLSGPDFTDTSQVGARTISYNGDNMPTQVTSVRGGTSTTVNYRYDGFRQRYKKEVVGGMTTYYLGDHFEIKGGTPVKYIFAGNLRVAQVEGTTLTYMHKDHLGSSTVMTNDSGFETESTQYMPFGSARPGSGEITETSYLYTDQEFDTENGLYNYNARLYDPVIGRFISPDTIVPQPFNPQSLNRYSYCMNNPLIYTDPTGHLAVLPVYRPKTKIDDTLSSSFWIWGFGGFCGGTGPYGGTNYLGIGLYEQWQQEQAEAEARERYARKTKGLNYLSNRIKENGVWKTTDDHRNAESFMQNYDSEGNFLLFVHGDKNGIYEPFWQDLIPIDEDFKKLMVDAGWTEGTPVFFLSCYGGFTPDNGISSAQQLADLLGVPVLAFDGRVGYNPDGTLYFYYPIDEDHPDIPDPQNPGEPFWVYPKSPDENNTGG